MTKKFRFTKRVRRVVFGIISVLLLLWAVLPRPTSSQLLSLCLVESRSCYYVALPEGDTLYLPLVPDAWTSKVATVPDSVNRTVVTTGCFVTPQGHVLTVDSLLGRTRLLPDTLRGDELRSRLASADSSICSASHRYAEELKALDFYELRHSVVDDGYNEVMAYRSLVAYRKRQADSMATLITRALDAKQAVRRTSYRLTLTAPADSGRVGSRDVGAVELHREGFILLLQAAVTAPASFFLKPYLLLRTPGQGMLGFDDFGIHRSASLPEVLTAPGLEGAVVLNKFRCPVAVWVGGKQMAIDTVARIVYKETGFLGYVGLNAWGRVENFFSYFFEDAPRVQKLPQATDRLQHIAYGDSARYFGEVVRSAQDSCRFLRSGQGVLLLATGECYEGVWRADTLVSGMRRTRWGVYRGTFNARLEAEGVGRFEGVNDEVYSGQWLANRRDGLGYSVKGNAFVRCGSWRNNTFRGERMVYTPERVYGIDISRYQHEKGRRRYGIDWNDLRIISLGKGRRANGTVNYPVSFVYIKCTEGCGVRNRYYAADRREARRRGIATGSYHFFSTRTPAAAQAKWFLRNSVVAKNELPPVLDVEPSDGQIHRMGGDKVLFREMQIWLDRVEAAIGRKPILYVSQTFVNEHLSKAPEKLRNYDMWIARYSEFMPYVHLLHWQLTPYGRVKGIHGDVDINVFNGTKEQWRAYLGE